MMETYAGTQRTVAVERLRDRLGGTEGNEALTIAGAVRAEPYASAGGMLWLRWKRFSGS
jgi:hypothetical protein